MKAIIVEIYSTVQNGQFLFKIYYLFKMYKENNNKILVFILTH